MKKKLIKFKILISFKGGLNWRNESIERQKKRKRIYLVLNFEEKTKSPIKFVKAYLDHINTNMPKHRLRKFHFIKKRKRRIK